MGEPRESRKPASGRFVLRLPPGLHAALRTAAREAGTSLNDHCVRLLARPGGGGALAAGVVLRALEVAGDALAGVVLFGSYARGEATEESDVDILVVLDGALPVSRELYRRWDARPLRWEGRRVEPHFVALPDATGPISGLWAEVSLEGAVLHERGLELSRRLAALRARIVDGALVRRWANGQPYWVQPGAGAA
jgi:predicted nucleotidyltransferase